MFCSLFLGGVSRKFTRLFGIVFAAFFFLQASAQEAENVVAQEFGDTGEATHTILILDASNSMWGEVEGQAKIEIAKEVATELIADLPDSLHLGLMAYGHRREGDCNDIELLIAPGEGSREALSEAISALVPRGKTPLVKAVFQAAEALSYQDVPGSVILVTDGVESCGGDLDALAEELAQQGLAFQANVIGFDLAGEDTQSLRNLAERTGGTYLDAENADELRAALEQVAEPEPVVLETSLTISAVNAEEQVIDGVEYRIFERGGEDPIFTEQGGLVSTEIEPGTYVVVAGYGEVFVRAELEILAGEQKEHQFAFVPGGLDLLVRMSEEGEPLEAGLAWQIYDGSGEELHLSYDAKPSFDLAAGEYEVEVRFGAIQLREKVQVENGIRLQKELVLQAGVLAPKLFYSDGGEVIENDMAWAVYAAQANLAGEREEVARSYDGNEEFFLVQGEYLLEARCGEAVVVEEVEVVSGQRVEPQIVLEAGLLSLTGFFTDGGEPLTECRWEVFEAKKNIAGEQRQVAGSYSPTEVFTVPAGEYLVVLTCGEARGEATIEVEAGTRAELELAVQAGILVVQTQVEENGERHGSARVQVLSAEANLAGEHVEYTSSYYNDPRHAQQQYVLPAGKYLLVGTNGGDQRVEQEVEVAAGQRAETELVLPKQEE